jgi:hypothetical protein
VFPPRRQAKFFSGGSKAVNDFQRVFLAMTASKRKEVVGNGYGYRIATGFVVRYAGLDVFSIQPKQSAKL